MATNCAVRESVLLEYDAASLLNIMRQHNKLIYNGENVQMSFFLDILTLAR
jgi:hypothetical protein